MERLQWHRQQGHTVVVVSVLIRRDLQIEQFETVYAYGDSPEDREMLALASRAYYQWREIAEQERAG